QFVDYSLGCETAAKVGGTTIVTPSNAGQAANAYGQTVEPLPTTDSSLEALAQLKGCVYHGPTTITFDSGSSTTGGTMTVWSPDTPTPSTCLPSQGGTVNVPNGANGNGVIYVADATTLPNGKTCSETTAQGANPFDNWNASTKKNGSNAQWGYNGTYYDYSGATSAPDCEGDAFVSDNPSGGGIYGQLTVAASNDIVITGDLQYADCGGSFSPANAGRTPADACQYNTGAINDSLGLIANQYVEVNHPITPNCNKAGTTCTAPTSATSNSLEPLCSSPSSLGTLGTSSAALCDPLTGSRGSGSLTIDAAILALNHSFLVNSEGLIDSSGNSYGIGNFEGNLVVYGSIDQDWRGPIGITGDTSGFDKDYDWDSRLEYVTPPYYLTPGTPAWGLASSATNLNPTFSQCGCSVPST
ncbi:MAG TPA: hypothetical protein VGL60_02860, partial [Acidimicrobiales bacterium]